MKLPIPGEWLVLGKAEIGEVKDAIGMDIPDTGEYDTFSGFVLDRLGRIPDEKDTFLLCGHSINVKEKDGNRILKYMVKKIVQETVPPEAEKT